jgi:hypothetical protein
MTVNRLWLIVAGCGSFSAGYALADAFPHSLGLMYLGAMASLIAYAALLALARRNAA